MEGHRWFFICVLVVGVVSVFSHEHQLKPISGGNNGDLRLSNGADQQGDHSYNDPSISSLYGRMKRYAGDDKERAKLQQKQLDLMKKGASKEAAFNKVTQKNPGASDRTLNHYGEKSGNKKG